MKTREFFFNLPEELIAQHPAGRREESRLMVVDRSSGSIEHRWVRELPDLVPPDLLMVFNNSRVRKARLFGKAKDTGSEVEFLLLRSDDRKRWTVMMKRAKRQKPGRSYLFPGGLEASIEESAAGEKILVFSEDLPEKYFERWGRMPLPPYIRRLDGEEDEERYQTVYSASLGSVAAPTAGLHFTPELLGNLDRNGIKRVSVTLHVGPGTFLPVRSENVEDHMMHKEEFEISAEASASVSEAKKTGRPVLAVGTTSVRVLESAWKNKRLVPGRSETDIFIYPGYAFQVVDKLFTNFHTPESSLLMLVSAFAGKSLIETAYNEAIKERYRFFSYGDAMLIL